MRKLKIVSLWVSALIMGVYASFMTIFYFDTGERSKSIIWAVLWIMIALVVSLTSKNKDEFY